MNVTTRVMSDLNASHCSSYINLTCSSKRSGTPAGRSSVGSSEPSRASIRWMRRSTSRTASRYSVTVVRSRRAERRLQLREIGRHRVENALVPLRLRDPLLRCPAISKQPLEHDTRIVLGRQRRRVGAPGKRVQIRAAVAVLALSAEEVEIDCQLERGQRGRLSQMKRRRSGPPRRRCARRRPRCACSAPRSATSSSRACDRRWRHRRTRRPGAAPAR